MARDGGTFVVGRGRSGELDGCGGEAVGEAAFEGGFVEGGLGMEEEVVGVGVGVEADEDFGVGDGVVDAVVEGVAEGLEEVERAFVAGGVTVVADDGEDGVVGAEGGDGDEVSEGGTEFLSLFAEDDVVDFGGVDVAAGVALVVVGGVGVGGLGDVVAGEGIVGALKDGDVGVVVVGEVADDFAVAASAVVGVAKVVEGVGAAGAVGVGSAVDVDIHAMREDVEVVLRGRRGGLRAYSDAEEEGSGKEDLAHEVILVQCNLGEEGGNRRKHGYDGGGVGVD
jgi:hypothetical protein